MNHALPTQNKHTYDVIIIGAGGAGLMCAIEAGKRGRKTLVLDHASKIGSKILIAGGGRCNFTNTGVAPDRYQSENMHFCKSAFRQYTQHDFIKMVEDHRINYHEKKLGQQFCDDSAEQIVSMLLTECKQAGVKIQTSATVAELKKVGATYIIETSSHGNFTCESLVIATGGLSIPKMGATNFGHRVAKQFGLEVTELTPALVPFTFSKKELEFYDGLSGISIDTHVSCVEAKNSAIQCAKETFRENILITHRGVSGPAILQISSYWKPGQDIKIHMLPDLDWVAFFKQARDERPKQELKTILSDILPKRFVNALVDHERIQNQKIGEIGNKQIAKLNEFFTSYIVKPNGTEGYRKAEVTLGGVRTNQLNANTLEVKSIEGLHFIGEVVDVTGWLGGYNFQWAWSSGYAAGQVV